jgi:transposase
MESITRVGIDASLEILDVLIDRAENRRFQVPNNLDGVKKLKAELKKGKFLIAIEASGRYEALARHELEAAGHTVKLQNPRQVRRLAEGLGIQAKTDSLDAEVLARTAELCATNEPRSKEREALGDVSRAIDTMKVLRAGYLRRAKVPGLCPVALKAFKNVAKTFQAEIKKLESEFVKLVKASSFKDRYRCALSVPNVGPNLARVAVCELPEHLENWNIRQLSSYAGVAPIDNSSGKRVGAPKVPKHKNVHLKGALFMPAMGAINRDAWAAGTYARLRARGVEHQKAVVPVMHKLLLHIVSVLKRGSAWEAEPPKRT